MTISGLRSRVAPLGLPADASEALARLIELFCVLPAPPGLPGTYPHYARDQARLVRAAHSCEAEEIEEALLTLYAQLHGHELRYTSEERRRLNESGGYWGHAGGLSPLLRAGVHLGPETVSADFGAGNGLQGLLLQRLFPHRLTRQIEISGASVEAGRQLAHWLEIPEERLEWTVGDVRDHGPQGLDFIYLYRPLRPEGEGLLFYERFARALEEDPRPVTIFSVADPLRPFLSVEFVRFYYDGQLSCYRREL